MDEIDEVAAAVDTLTTALESDDDVAHAEVGGFVRDRSTVILTEEGVRSSHAFLTTGVWCRVLADGASAYRQSTVLDEATLQTTAETAARSATQLAQERPESYDPETTHRAAHPGWADDPVSAVGPDAKSDRLVAASEDALADRELDRLRLEYADEHLVSMLSTTAGTLLTTTLDRASADLSVAADGVTVRRHRGSTDGSTLEGVDSLLTGAVADVDRLAATEPETPPAGRLPIVLGPRAAGQLVTLLSRAFEGDVVLAEGSPLERGDRIAPRSLSIEDGVRAGSWAARPFDAEGRPTAPVRLLGDGVVRNYLHSVSSAATLGGTVAGSVIPSIGFESAPRIHARHLDVDPGERSVAELSADASVCVDRFRAPWQGEGLLRKLRSGWAPPGAHYTSQLAEKIPDAELAAGRGRTSLPIAEGYLLDGGEPVGRLEGATYEFSIEDLRTLEGASARRGTVTGVSEKHKSRLPYAVTAPALRLTGRIRP